MLVLRELQSRDEASFRDAVGEFGKTDPDFEFGFRFGPDVRFDHYVEWLQHASHGRDLPVGWVPHTFFVGVVGDDIVGRLSLRHQLDDFLRDYGGHVGFGVRASQRRRGYATAMLRAVFPHARELGIDRLLVTCDDQNVGSITVIERCGGIFEDLRPRDEGGLTRRYWIPLER